MAKKYKYTVYDANGDAVGFIIKEDVNEDGNAQLKDELKPKANRWFKKEDHHAESLGFIGKPIC